MPLPVGTKAPDFTLKTLTPDGFADFTLSDNFGKKTTVLMFVPGAFTHVCTKQFCEVTDDLNRYSDLGADVYGISVDSAYCQNAWKKQEGYAFPLLSDFEHKVTQAYDVVLPSLSGLGPASQRATFVIDQDGVIRYVEQTASTLDSPDLGALQEALNGLR